MYAGVALTSRSLCHLPVVGARRLDRGRGWRSPVLSGFRRVFLTSQPGALDLHIPSPQGTGAPLLHSSFQLVQGTSHAELSDPQDPSPAHAGILVSGFTAVPTSKMPISSPFSPPPAHATRAPSGQFLVSLKASEAREDLRGPMRWDATEQVVDPPSGSLRLYSGVPSPVPNQTRPEHPPTQPRVSALDRIRTASAPLASPTRPSRSTVRASPRGGMASF